VDGAVVGDGDSAAIIRSPATHVYEFHLMLYPSVLAEDESGHAILVTGAITMTALVLLAGRLPGHAKLSSDLRPSDAQVDSVVDQHCEFRLCLLLRDPGAPDSLQHLGGSHRRIPLRQDMRLRECLGLRPGCTCLALGPDRRFRLPMRSSMRARYDNPGCPSW
jgi:hypothetical protein